MLCLQVFFLCNETVNYDNDIPTFVDNQKETRPDGELQTRQQL